MPTSKPSSFDELRSQARIRAALDGIITIDANGVIVEWNPAAERIFGYTAAEAIGQEMAALIVPSHMRQPHRDGMAHYMATGEGPALDTRLEMPAITKNGRDITIELTITAFTAGEEQWFTGWTRDVTEQKATEAELARAMERFEAIVEHSSDVITVLGPDGDWQYTSQAGTRLTGYPKGHSPPGGIFSLLHPDDVPVSQVALRELLEGTRGPDEPVELRLTTANGELRWFETTGVNMLENPAVGGIGA
jgi:PAS domain S-box-containing protein